MFGKVDTTEMYQLLREKLTLVTESIPSSEDFERKSSSEENPNPNTYKPKVVEHH